MSEPLETAELREGSFDWCVEQLDLGDPALTAICQAVCVEHVVWPEQLLGRSRAGNAACVAGNPPISTGHMLEPGREPRMVDARRLAWYLAGQFTDMTATMIGEAFGGHKPGTVKPWLNFERFEKYYALWHQNGILDARRQRLIDEVSAKLLEN